GEFRRARRRAGRRGAADRHDVDRLARLQPGREMRQLDRNLHHLGRHFAIMFSAGMLGAGMLGAGWQQPEMERGDGQGCDAEIPPPGHSATPSLGRPDAAAGRMPGRSTGIRSTVLYHAIIRAVRNMTATPAALTASCSGTAEPYSVRMKWPRAERMIPRQKISSDC